MAQCRNRIRYDTIRYVVTVPRILAFILKARWLTTHRPLPVQVLERQDRGLFKVPFYLRKFTETVMVDAGINAKWNTQTTKQASKALDSEIRLLLLTFMGSCLVNIFQICIQQDAPLHSLFISGNCSTCFGWYLHPSSGAYTTISTISGMVPDAVYRVVCFLLIN
jgi:hypothetical protein